MAETHVDRRMATEEWPEEWVFVTVRVRVLSSGEINCKRLNYIYLYEHEDSQAAQFTHHQGITAFISLTLSQKKIPFLVA